MAPHSGRKATAETAALPPAKLRLSVQNALAADVPADLPARSTLRRWLLCALRRDALITVRFVGAAEGRRLNRTFRNRDYATNVLTFTYDTASAGSASPADLDALHGDIVLCVPVLRREARAARITLHAHCAHLLIHGALHLQGLDHESAKDAKVMEALETRLLASLGHGDPYATT